MCSSSNNISDVNFTALPSLHAATMFLTRPFAFLSPPKFKDETRFQAFQLSLQSTLVGFYVNRSQAVDDRRNFSLSLLLTPLELPPPPIQSACIEFNIEWSDWIRLLGESAFTLVIQPERVYLTRETKSTSIWVSQAQAARTSARGVVIPNQSGSPDEVFEEDEGTSDSRPSSRCSAFSSFSFDSASDASLTSFSSFESHAEPKHSTTSTAASPLPYPVKYLYRGGVSTVLTGGVMLGPSSARATPTPTAMPSKSLSNKSIPPAVSRYIPPALRVPTEQTESRTHTSSWRRST